MVLYKNQRLLLLSSSWMYFCLPSSLIIRQLDVLLSLWLGYVKPWKMRRARCHCHAMQGSSFSFFFFPFLNPLQFHTKEEMIRSPYMMERLLVVQRLCSPNQHFPPPAPTHILTLFMQQVLQWHMCHPESQFSQSSCPFSWAVALCKSCLPWRVCSGGC